MPRFLNQITEEGNSVPSSSNDTVNDIIYVTQQEFDILVSQNKLVEGTIYMIDESGGGSELDGCPIGAIMMWAASSIPTGWTICDGKATPSDADSSFKTLFSSNIPDLRNKFIVGVGTETEFNTLAKTGGSKYIQAHTHSDNFTVASAGAHTHTDTFKITSAGVHTHTKGTFVTSSTGAHTHRLKRASAGQTDFTALGEFTNRTSGKEPVQQAGNYIWDSISPTTTSAGAHTHTISGNSSSAGAHVHTISGSIASAGAHTHTINGAVGAVSGVTTGTSGNLPPYYALYFIIKYKKSANSSLTVHNLKVYRYIK